MRRGLVTLLCAAIALGGCAGGTPNAQQAARKRFLGEHKALHDDELARLCPSLYPTDYVKDPKKYGYTTTKQPVKPTPADMASARAAGCTSTGTPPRKK